MPPNHQWTLDCPQGRYAFRLRDTGLACDCIAAAPAAPGGVTQPAPMVVTGTTHTPVTWAFHASQQPDRGSQVIELAARNVPLLAEISLVVDQDTGLMIRRTTLLHRGQGASVDIRATLSCWIDIHEPLAWMLYLSGHWGDETQVQVRRPGNEPLVLESRAGKTGFGNQPYVALGAKHATYVCQLLWSGNWSLRVQPHAAGAALSGGFNNWAFRHCLNPGDRLVLPTVLFGRFAGDLDHATQRLHDWRRRHRPDPDHPIPVQFNSWYPHQGEPNFGEMLSLIPQAQRLGCEVFVLDSGWFATDTADPKVAWEQRTGDWDVSLSRFPPGLGELSRRCAEHGLMFGLWFEPEVIGPLSAIRHEHPEWLHHIDGKPPAADARAILNPGIPAARRHVLDRISRVLAAARVAWMKWDFNADLGAGGWAPGLPASLTQQDPLVAHYTGLYHLMEEIRTAFPTMILEMCASGGGRLDAEILSRAHVNWISDQPGPVRKLAIHLGSQLAHPAVVCNDWLVEWPPGGIPGYDNRHPETDLRGNLAFRLRVAMLGSLGVSAPLERWSATDIAEVASHIALYRSVLRPIIQDGDQYLLLGAGGSGETGWRVVWYVAKDGMRGVLFAFRLAGGDTERTFALPGLRPAQRYRMRRFPAPGEEVLGSALAAGLRVSIPMTFGSALCVVEPVAHT